MASLISMTAISMTAVLSSTVAAFGLSLIVFHTGLPPNSLVPALPAAGHFPRTGVLAKESKRERVRMLRERLVLPCPRAVRGAATRADRDFDRTQNPKSQRPYR